MRRVSSHEFLCECLTYIDMIYIPENMCIGYISLCGSFCLQDFTISTMPPALIRLLRAFALMLRVYLKCGCISWKTCIAY
jgi:hypothetical protein